MGAWIELKPEDSEPIAAWRADPQGKPRGGVVVVQEIFGVNAHIREVAERFAGEGYLAVAPALFDRAEKGFDVAYDSESAARGMAITTRLERQQMLRDVAAAAGIAREGGKVAVVGYCLGGTLAWSAAGRLANIDAAVGYYGGGIAALKDLKPRVPVMLHFGEEDGHIPIAGVREIAAAHPDTPVFLYPAGHGFSCDHRSAYHAPSAALAWTRTLDFLRETLR